jgi:hypothetical protein
MATERNQLLERLHDLLTTSLIEKIESGEATAADFGVARQLLKDNNINAIPVQNSPILRLSQTMPFQDSQEAV